MADKLESFVDDCLAILANNPAMALCAPVVRPGSLWLSRATGRRASVLGTSQGYVCLSYDETRIDARKIHSVPDFLRLYSEAQ